MNQKSFTVIELLVVIALIGLLASIVLVSFNLPEKRYRATVAKSLEFSQSIQHALGIDAAGWWNFDDDIADGQVTDTSGNGNHGNLCNGATCATPPTPLPPGQGPQQVDGVKLSSGAGTGKALSFDGGDDYVDAGNTASLKVTGDMTIEFWAKPSSVASGRQNIVCKAYGGEGCLTMEPDGQLSFYFGACGGECSPYVELNRPPAGTFKDNEWIHAVITRDVSTRTYKMYKNGVVAATDSWVPCGIHPCGDPTASTLSLKIGAGYAGYFHGLIDEVRIYSQALTAQQIQQHYVEGLKRHQDLVQK